MQLRLQLRLQLSFFGISIGHMAGAGFTGRIRIARAATASVKSIDIIEY